MAEGGQPRVFLVSFCNLREFVTHVILALLRFRGHLFRTRANARLRALTRAYARLRALTLVSGFCFPGPSGPFWALPGSSGPFRALPGPSRVLRNSYDIPMNFFECSLEIPTDVLEEPWGRRAEGGAEGPREGPRGRVRGRGRDPGAEEPRGHIEGLSRGPAQRPR